MRIGTIPETLLERIGAAAGAIPTPIFDTTFACLGARSIMLGVRDGVFDALDEGPRTAAEVARLCRLAPMGAERLLNSLVAGAYLTTRGARYALTRGARRWLTQRSPDNVCGWVLFNFDQWRLIEGLDQYVERGTGVDFHGRLGPEAWARYQAGMLAATKTWTEQTARELPAPPNPKTMLDVGGSHGAFSAALCRRHPGLQAVILDLPAALEAAAPLIEAHGLAERLVPQPGDVLADDLGEARYDIVFMSQLAHHFSDEQNRDVARRAARALKPGGVFAILEQVAVSGVAEARRADRRMGAMLDLYFGATSEARTWTVGAMRDWQEGAGLRAKRVIWMRSVPGVAVVAAVKPRRH